MVFDEMHGSLGGEVVITNTELLYGEGPLPADKNKQARLFV